MSNASTAADRAKPRGADVPRTTTRYPSGNLRLGGRACDRAERLLLLCCRNHTLLNRGTIGFATWALRGEALRSATEAARAESFRRERALVGGAA